MSITEKALEIIADIGMNAAKEKFILKADEAKVRKKLVDYLTRQQKHNFNCTTAEEIDFEGLAEYIRDNLMADVEVRLFGTKEERDAARQTIANKAEHYATAKTNLSKERSKQLTFAAVDILRKFFRAKVGRNLLYVATEIEDTVISEMTNQHKETNDKIDNLKNFIQDCNPLSLDKNISLAKCGELGEVEKNLSIYIDSLSATHVLKPYYGYALDETSQLKSIPLRADALECYPPRLKFTATAFEMGGVSLPQINANTFTRAYQSQSTIEFNITTAQKYLGSVLDPVQHEAEKIAGTHMILVPPAFPSAFPCSVLLDGKPAVNYLLLRTKQIEENGTIIVTNDEQKNFNFRVKIAINTSTRNVNWSVTPINPSNTESLNYRRFLKQTISAKRVELKALDSNVIFISAKANLAPQDALKLDEEIKFLEKIVVIENYFQVAFTIPSEVTVSDLQVVDYLYSIISEGKHVESCKGFTISFDLTEKLRQSLCDLGEKSCIFSFNMDVSVELFNQTFNFGILRTMDCVRLEHPEKIRKKLNALDEGDPLKIPFISGNNESDIYFSDIFYSEETENQ